MRRTIVALVFPLTWALGGCSSADLQGPPRGPAEPDEGLGPSTGGSEETTLGAPDGDRVGRGGGAPALAFHGERAAREGARDRLDPALVDRYVPAPVERPEMPGRVPQIVAGNVVGLGALAASDDAVFYVADGQARAIPREGMPLAPLGQRISSLAGLAVDAKSVYFTERDGSVRRADRSTNDSEVVFAGHGPTFGLGLRGSLLHWVERDDVLGDRVFTGRPGDGAPHVAATPGAAIKGTAATADHVYYTTGDGRVMRSSRVEGCEGSACTLTIAADQVGPASIAVNDGWVWWATSDGRLHAVSLVDGAHNVVAVVDGTVRNLTADARGVYFTVDTASRGAWIGWAQGGGKHAVALAAHRTGIDAFAADATALYWTDPSLGAVFRLPK